MKDCIMKKMMRKEREKKVLVFMVYVMQTFVGWKYSGGWKFTWQLKS